MVNRKFQDIELLPELVEWKKLYGNDFSIDAWLDKHHTPELMIAYTRYFMPTFIRIDNGIFLKDNDEATDEAFSGSLNQLRMQFTGSDVAYQHLQNTRILSEYIGSQNALYYPQLTFLANTLTYLWQLQLNHQFPNLVTKVQVFDLDERHFDNAYITLWAE